MISRPPALMSMLPLVLRAACREFKIKLGEGLVDFIYLFCFSLNCEHFTAQVQMFAGQWKPRWDHVCF